jgi:cardiolipin synthase
MTVSIGSKAAKIYPHDRLMARTILPLIPPSVTPNHITILRLLLTPVTVWLVYARQYDVAIPFFLLVAFTDAVDGSLARVTDRVTEWGMVWDPVADKILIVAIALVLLFRHFSPEVAVVIFGLEAAFLVGGYYWKRKGLIVSANVWGKFKMITQVLGIALFLLFLDTGFAPLVPASYAAFGLATVFALISLFRHGI